MSINTAQRQPMDILQAWPKYIRACALMRLSLCLSLGAPEAAALTEDHAPSTSDAIFYTFTVTAVVVSAGLVAAYREFRWMAYIMLSSLLLLSVASMDGSLTYLLGGGNFVLWVLPFLILSTTTAIGFLVVALRLEAPHRLTRLRPAFVVLALLTALLPLSSALWLERISLAIMWIPLNVLFFSMLLSQALPPRTWLIQDRLQRLLTRVVPVAVGSVALAVQLSHYLGGGFSQLRMNQLNRATALFFVVFLLVIVVWQVVANTRQKIRTERQALASERNEAQLQLALVEARTNYRDALSAASRHRSKLATVSHDLKQPITALRHAAEQMQRAGHRHDADRLARATDYIASLSRAYVDESEAAGANSHTDDNAAGGAEVVDSLMFARMLEQMFSVRAHEQGIRLRIVCPYSRVRVEPLATMRVMANLLSNALDHASATRILVAFRPRGDQVIFQVHDNGVGMEEETLASFVQPGMRGLGSEGHGLGLGIVEELCYGAGMRFRLRSMCGRGTSACVSLPRQG